ncbi:hypothetical protein [Afipia felis]|uniref:Uncharacterized protein n=2 Tax=Afipia felis TaxID=1035 RepID=A0A380WAQ9_AFIFE|nr:hypothetical protein [Afipia felis]EKS29307.1 hypothetical protein HMPREF9697_01835 [Afipia felis ATCC 53690]SUU78015.1 Uncharacterised protein [Afipia felis]SUU86080.1 Uncharacterised protein [Afipia felis]
MSISANVIILTREEFRAQLDESFQKGVRRGRFEEQSDQSQAKATKGKAGMAGVTDTVRRSTAGTGLRVGEAGVVQPATSEIMDVTAGETAPTPAVDREAVARLVGMVRALLKYTNPTNVAEDHSQQWQAVDHECDRILPILAPPAPAQEGE